MAVCKLSSWGIITDKCETPKNIVEAKYCKVHGCSVCNYVNLKSSFNKNNSSKKIEAVLGKDKLEVCSEGCKSKIQAKYKTKIESEELEEKLRKKFEAQISKSVSKLLTE